MSEGNEINAPVNLQVITPYGYQLKEQSPWLPQEPSGQWPHKASSLSLGESTVLKYSVTFPLRTGLDYDDFGRPFPEHVSFYQTQERKKIEEIFISGGICIVSEGPLGGPSSIKALHRPLNSYGSGVGVQSVVKTQFPRDKDEGTQENQKDSYYCLVEKGGISLHAEGKSETHVAYMPEFQIDRAIPCKFGLLVVPLRPPATSTDDSRFLYMLTHPVKQVSRIWYKDSPGNDFYEYDNTTEKLLCCENDLCVFWNLRSNDGFSIKRLHHLEKTDIVHSSTLNASIYYTNQETTSSPFTPAGGASMYSSFGRPIPKASAMRMNKEGATVYYWPTFDFSNMSGHGLSVGFYPPHFCVYDDPEFYLTTLFDIKLNPRVKWKEPQKFQFVHNHSDKNVVGLWFTIQKNLYLYSVNVGSGSKLSNYAVNGVRDFCCSEGTYGAHMIAILTDSNQIKLGFLDERFLIVTSMNLSLDKKLSISSIDNFLFCDTLICSLNSGEEKAVISLKSISKCNLIALCLEKMSEVVPQSFIAKLMSEYISVGASSPTENLGEWAAFSDIIKRLLQTDEADKQKSELCLKVCNVIQDLKESLKSSRLATDYVQRLLVLSKYALEYSQSEAQSSPHGIPSLFQSFLDSFAGVSLDGFSKLPEIMQTLLDRPDTLNSIKILSDLKLGRSSLAPALDLLVADVFQRNHFKVKFGWPEIAIRNVGRLDYLVPNAITTGNSGNEYHRHGRMIREKEQQDDEDDAEWTSHVLDLRIFASDRRLEEVCRLLDSASPLIIDVEQRAEMSDHEFLEEQEKHLLQQMQVTLSAPLGRGALTLKTEVKTFANLTNVIHIPRLCLSGKSSTRGNNIELNDLDANTSAWPSFHNAVASSISVRFSDQPADAWFAYSKAKTTEGPEQAGMILGFGLSRILTAMPPTLRHEYLSKENSFLSMSMLLGLSANSVGSGDIATWKVISLHIGAMLPACTTELEIPRLATLVAPCALGLLFMGTQNSHIAKVLLGEISKRYNPLSIFGGGNGNNSATNVNTAESNGNIVDREAHSLCAGFGLGFVNLGKSRVKKGCMDDDGFDGILRRFVVGGPKPQTSTDDDEDMYNQYGQNLPSLWEEYRCCHIEEGDNVNVDVTTPSAIVAVALTYLRSGNEAVLKWLSPPTTLHLLDGVRPDILLLRSLASILVYEELTDLSVKWLESYLMPVALAKSALTKPNDYARFDHESINQAWASIVCGYCLGIGIRFAGTSDNEAVATLWHYTDMFLNICTPESQVTEYFPKNFLESSICTLLISLSLVLAGTGNIPVLQLCRYMQSKIAGNQITTSTNTYGLEMCTSMATGILFLGGGRYSLSNDDRSIAVLLAAVFPKWPINSSDNRYHLQALRHLYVLAAQPRLILPKPMPHRAPLHFHIEYRNGQIVKAKAPVLLPPFYLLKKISLSDAKYFPIEFRLPEDLKYLQKIVEGDGIIPLVRRPVTSIKYNFLKHMAWRESRIFHGTFSDDPEIPIEERYEIKELDLLSRMADTAGLRPVVTALMSLKNEDATKVDWQLQLRMLYWWTSLKSDQVPSSIPVEFLGLFLNKANNEFKIFSPDA